MKTLIQKYFHVVAVLFLVAGCDADISGSFGDDPDPGSADFSTFVALGDSLTAGYADGALYRHGQENSFPALMAQQFVSVGGGVFNQPLMPVGATGSLSLTGIGDLGFSDRLVLVATDNPERPASPAPITPTQSTSIDLPALVGPFNNMGVPGAKSYHLGVNTYGNPANLPAAANPYFIRFASSTGATMIGDAAVQVPSFFVLWIGNDDVFSYAISGGIGVVGVGAPPYGRFDITDPAVFPGIYNGILGTINTPGNKGVLINIPDVSTIPYFTTVPYNPIPMDEATAAASNAAYAPYNGAIAGSGLPAAEIAQRTIVFAASEDNALVIEDDSLTDLTGFGLPSIRQATADDLIVLPASSKIGVEDTPGDPSTTWGVGMALEDADVLTESEVGLVETARTAYNVAIKTAADADPNLLLFDMDAYFTELNTTGILYGSGGISSTFAQGGAFSLDGVHPTARGYAVIANEMFKVINAGFGGYIPPVNPSDYSTVFYQ